MRHRYRRAAHSSTGINEAATSVDRFCYPAMLLNDTASSITWLSTTTQRAISVALKWRGSRQGSRDRDFPNLARRKNATFMLFLYFHSFVGGILNGRAVSFRLLFDAFSFLPSLPAGHGVTSHLCKCHYTLACIYGLGSPSPRRPRAPVAVRAWRIPVPRGDGDMNDGHYIDIPLLAEHQCGLAESSNP